MDNTGMKGDEIRHGKHIYLDAPSKNTLESFDDTPLSDAILYHLNDGRSAIQPDTAYAAAQRLKSGDGIVFALRLIDSSRCIGFAQLDEISWQARHAVLAVAILDGQYLQQHIIADAIQILLKFAFMEANLNRIELECVEDDEQLRLVLDHLNITFEGKCRQEAYRDGQYLSVLMYSMLASRWLSIYK